MKLINGYIARRVVCKKGTWRTWYLVKSHPSGIKEELGRIKMSNQLSLPKEYIGKRIRFRIELMNRLRKEEQQ